MDVLGVVGVIGEDVTQVLLFEFNDWQIDQQKDDAQRWMQSVRLRAAMTDRAPRAACRYKEDCGRGVGTAGGELLILSEVACSPGAEEEAESETGRPVRKECGVAGKNQAKVTNSKSRNRRAVAVRSRRTAWGTSIGAAQQCS